MSKAMFSPDPAVFAGRQLHDFKYQHFRQTDQLLRPLAAKESHSKEYAEQKLRPEHILHIARLRASADLSRQADFILKA